MNIALNAMKSRPNLKEIKGIFFLGGGFPKSRVCDKDIGEKSLSESKSQAV